jgi:hypothetical protein
MRSRRKTMGERKIKVSLMPGAETPEGAARLRKEVEARGDLDFRAFQLLQQLVNDDFVNRMDIILRLKEFHGESKKDATEMGNELMDEIEQLLRDRRLADHYVLAAAAGHPDPREED